LSVNPECKSFDANFWVSIMTHPDAMERVNRSPNKVPPATLQAIFHLGYLFQLGKRMMAGTKRYGASVRGPKCNGVIDGRTAALYHFPTYAELEEMRQEQKHNNKPAKTPRPWWRSRPPLQRRGVDGSTRSNVRATRPWYWVRSWTKN
jgi:hypothetical protein